MMTTEIPPKRLRDARFGPLKPSGTRLAQVLGQLKTANDRNTSPIYEGAVGRAEKANAVTPNSSPQTSTNDRRQNARERAAFEAILAPHMDELYGAALRFTRSPSDADDVLQEAMARAWMFWNRFEAGTNVRAWMHRILYNTFVNRYRKNKREREVLTQIHEDNRVLTPNAGHGEVAPCLEGLGDEVCAAMKELPLTFRTVVERVDLRGESYRDAARAIGCPVGTVMSRLHRGRRLLKEALRDYAAAEGYVAAA